MTTPQTANAMTANAAALRVRRNARRKELSLLLLRGYRDRSMLAEHFGVSRKTIAKDISALDARWEVDQLDFTARRKGRLLAELQLLKREAWQAWQESKRPELEEVATEPAAGGIDKQTRRKTTGPRPGDPRYLERIGDCLTKECMILGIRAPRDEELSQNITLNQLQIDIGSLTPDAVGILCNAILERERIASRPGGVQAELESQFLAEEEAPELIEDAAGLSAEERAAAQVELGLGEIQPQTNGEPHDER